jgi:hypothetical protein
MSGKLSPEARSLIRDALAEEPLPSGAHRDRLRRGVLARAAAGGAVTLVGSSVAKASGYALFSTVASSVGLGFGAGLVLAGAAQFAFTPSVPSVTKHEVPAASARSPRAPAALSARLALLVPSSATLPAVAAPPSAAFAPVPSKAPALNAAASAGASTPAVLPSADASANAGSALRDELDLMARVQEALRDAHGARALELIARYDAQHPSGSLETERIAAEVFAACQVGDPARAHRAAQRFLTRDSASPLAARVKSACPTENDEAR